MIRPARLLLAAAAVTAALASGAPVDAPGVASPRLDAVRVLTVAHEVRLPGAAPSVLDRELVLDGEGFYGTAHGPFVDVVLPDGSVHAAPLVLIESGARLRAWPPPGLRGAVTLVVRNPDGRVARIATAL